MIHSGIVGEAWQADQTWQSQHPLQADQTWQSLHPLQADQTWQSLHPLQQTKLPQVHLKNRGITFIKADKISQQEWRRQLTVDHTCPCVSLAQKLWELIFLNHVCLV